MVFKIGSVQNKIARLKKLWYVLFLKDGFCSNHGSREINWVFGEGLHRFCMLPNQFDYSIKYV